MRPCGDEAQLQAQEDDLGMERWEKGSLIVDEGLKITSHDYIRVTCENCGKVVFAIEDTTPEKKGTVNLKTETGVTVIFLCESCKATKPSLFYLPRPKPEL